MDDAYDDGRLSFMRDTPIEAQRAYYAVIRQMRPEARLKQAMRLSRRVREMSLEGIRRRHPDYTKKQVMTAWFRMIMKDEEFEGLFPGVEIEI